jgi:hypothetical protein
MNCPRCFNSFHRDHLAAWLLRNKKCPICREVLSEAFREELRPKTERERQRLEDIFATLDNLGDMMSKLEGSRKYGRRIKESRSEEFGIQGIGIGEIIKVVIPFVLIGIAGVFLILGFLNGF